MSGGWLGVAATLGIAAQKRVQRLEEFCFAELGRL
jgi:hypothetical protein